MDQQVAEAVAKQIPRDCLPCVVEGIREQDGAYVVDVRHTGTNAVFAVASREDWEQQLRDGRLPVSAESHL